MAITAVSTVRSIGNLDAARSSWRLSRVCFHGVVARELDTQLTAEDEGLGEVPVRQAQRTRGARADKLPVVKVMCSKAPAPERTVFGL